MTINRKAEGGRHLAAVGLVEKEGIISGPQNLTFSGSVALGILLEIQ